MWGRPLVRLVTFLGVPHTVQEVLGQVVPDVEAIGGDIGKSVELHRGAELRSSSCTCRTPSDPH